MIHEKVLPQNSVENFVIRDVIGNKTDDENGNSIYSKLYIVERHIHSPTKLYPTLVNAKVINKVNSDAWGLDADPVEVIPVNTITNPFDIHFINIGAISNLDEYELLLFKGINPVEVEIARVSFDRSSTQTEGSIPVQTELLAANTRISAKLTSKAALSRSISIKLYYHEY